MTGYELPVPPEAPEEDWLNAPAEPEAPIPAVASIAQRMQHALEVREPALAVPFQPPAPEQKAPSATNFIPPAAPAEREPVLDLNALDVPAPAPHPAEPAWAAEPFEQTPTAPRPQLDEALDMAPGAARGDAPIDLPSEPEPLLPPQPAIPQVAQAASPAGADSASAPVPSGAAPEAAQQPDPALAPAADEELVPEFVKQAQRKAWWNQPAVRFAMGMLVMLLPIALVLQIAIHERNTLVAWKPQWRPVFETMCLALRCTLSPRKHIASVVLTGSSFAQDARPNHYRLDISIQNRSELAVATPGVELTLTDAQDQVLVRKVLDLSEIGAPPELAGHSEWNGTLPVKTQGLNLPVSGYRVTAFYP